MSTLLVIPPALSKAVQDLMRKIRTNSILSRVDLWDTVICIWFLCGCTLTVVIYMCSHGVVIMLLPNLIHEDAFAIMLEVQPWMCLFTIVYGICRINILMFRC